MADPGTELQKPGAPAPTNVEPVIHVIPEKFYGAALKQKAPPLKPTPPVIPAAALESTPPPPPTVPGAPVPKKKKFPILLILILAVILLGGGGTAAYFLLIKKAPVVNTPPVTIPAGPVCGNGKCESPTESTSSCLADCPAPAPVCGDSKCEEGKETPDSCASDCGLPAPKCGDNKCDTGETSDSCLADCKPEPIVSGLDADSDGLTDEEEKTVYGTNASNPNTDNDKFVDLNEVLSLFDPAKPEPAMLRDNPGIASYTNRTLGIELLRPAGWTVSEQEDTKQVTFSAQGGESFKLRAVAKEATQSLKDWYTSTYPAAAPEQAELSRTRQGYDAIVSPDRQTIHVDGGTGVFIATYELGPRKELQYKVTFQMLTQSLKVSAK